MGDRTDRNAQCRRALLDVSAAVVVLLMATVLSGAGLVAATTTTTTPVHPVLASESGSYVFTLTFDGLERDYRLHVPPAAASGQPLPLVLNLHGATQNSQLEEITSDMDPNAGHQRLPGGVPRRNPHLQGAHA